MPLNDRSDLAELVKYFLARVDRFHEEQLDRHKEVRQHGFWSLVIASSLSALFASILGELELHKGVLIIIGCILLAQVSAAIFLIFPKEWILDFEGSEILGEIDKEDKISGFEDQMIRILRAKEDSIKKNERKLEGANRILIFVYLSLFTQLGLWLFLFWSSL